MNTTRTGLVLGSGSSRGWAHIGVIEALQEAGIPIHCVAGCSVGAFVGAVFASGGLERLKECVLHMDGKSVHFTCLALRDKLKYFFDTKKVFFNDKTTTF